MKRINDQKFFTLVSTLLLLPIITIACNPVPKQETPTQTQTLSFTDTPTFTSSPLPTMTSTSTVTPDMTATYSANATMVTAERLKLIKPELDLVGYPETGSITWYQVDAINIVPAKNQTLFYKTIDEKLIAGDFIFKTDITWSATSLVFCGFNFRAGENIEKGNHYEFLFLRISGLPGWDIEYHEGDEFVSTITERIHFSDAMKTENNATNEFILVARGNQFTVYINKIRQGTFFDYGNKLTEGQFAFLAFEDSGASSCKYDNSWLWSY